MEYEPSEIDLQWGRMMVNILKDRGHWGCDWGLYQLDQVDKRVILILRNPAYPEELFQENHAKTIKCFGAIGWEVVEDEDRDQAIPGGG